MLATTVCVTHSATAGTASTTFAGRRSPSLVGVLLCSPALGAEDALSNIPKAFPLLFLVQWQRSLAEMLGPRYDWWVGGKAGEGKLSVSDGQNEI